MKRIENIVEHFIAHGWAICSIKEITEHIQPVLTGFKSLITREEAYREKWKFHITELSKKPDHGLLPPKGSGYDQKHMLMYRRNLRGMLNERFAFEEIQPYDEMLYHLGIIFNIAFKNLLKFAAEFDRQLPGYSLHTELNKRSLMDTHVLRVPEYIFDATAPDRIFSAQPHLDLSAVTMQLFQTDGGLIVQDYLEEVVEYSYDPTEATVFLMAGDKLEQLTLGRMRALPHGVLAKAKRNRNSGMFFAHTGHPTRERDGQHDYPNFERSVRKYLGLPLQVAA